MTDEVTNSTYVLIHGAYHGGWCWESVARELQPSTVYAPTLSGLSDRASESARSIGLDTHVREVVSLIEKEDLENVHLVGWSYGGLVATSVLSQIPTRVAAISYLDAYLPEHGQSAASFLPMVPRLLLHLSSWLGKGIKAPDPRKWGFENEELCKSVEQRLTDQPPRTLTQSVNAPEPWPEHVNYSYIWCKGYVGSMFGQFYEKAERDPRFQVFELDSSHASPLTHPQDVARMLSRKRT